MSTRISSLDKYVKEHCPISRAPGCGPLIIRVPYYLEYAGVTEFNARLIA
jgi:hypothetical protein